MSARKTTRRVNVSAEHHVDERWMASYMDMVTVLMCLFIVLFAMSHIDQKKYQELKQSLASGFGVVDSKKTDKGQIIVPPDLVGKDGEMSDVTKAAALELDWLQQLERKIDASLAQHDLQNTVGYDIDSRGLTVHLIGADTFFTTNSAELTPVAKRVIAAISDPLDPIKNQLSIEGHADKRVPEAPYPTNWELSSARAVSVLREMVEQGHVAGTRVGAVGYGDERPAARGDSATELAKNRRVDIVVISTAPEDVRKLIPKLVAAQQKATTAASAQGSPTSTGAHG